MKSVQAMSACQRLSSVHKAADRLFTVHRSLFTLVVSLLIGGTCPQASASPVRPELAQAAATEKVHIILKGSWQYHTNLVYYGLDGNISAYAMVFKRADRGGQETDIPSVINSGRAKLVALEKELAQKSAEAALSAVQKNDQIVALRASIAKAIAAMRGDDVFATVITSADDGLPVVRKCHPGLPAVLVQEEDARELLKAKSRPDLAVGRYLYLGPFDDTYEVVGVSQATGGAGVPASDGMVLDLRTRSLETVENLKRKEQARGTRGDLQLQERSRSEWDKHRQKAAK